MFFGMGPLEILIIGAIALVVIGPEKFPDVAKVFFKTVRDLRGYWDDVKQDVAEELKPMKEEVNQLKQIDANKYIDNLVSPEVHDADGDVLEAGIGDFENDDDDFMPTEAGEKMPGQMNEDDEEALMNADYPGSEDIIAADSDEDSAQSTYGPPEAEYGTTADEDNDVPEDLGNPIIEDQDNVTPEPYNPEADFHQQDYEDGGEEDDDFAVDEPERLE